MTTGSPSSRFTALLAAEGAVPPSPALPSAAGSGSSLSLTLRGTPVRMPAVISKTVLVLTEAFGNGLDAMGVGAALARGLGSAAALDCDLCPLGAGACAPAPVGETLHEHDFDRRLRAARCLVVATARLDDDTLAGSVAFEAATRARQCGVPAYAVTAHNRLDP